MPIGIIINVLSVIIGGFAGAAIKDRLPQQYRTNLTMLFGAASMGMGIASIVLMENMPAVILALILGLLAGMMMHLGEAINKGAGMMIRMIGGSEENSQDLITVIVLFCASGTGIYGSLVSGMNGDHSILIAKSFLDFFTALIFACSLGKSVSLVGIPQFVIMILLYILAGVIFPLTTPAMINDFKACGGFLMLATGFRIMQLKAFPTADMIPAMILVMPLSKLWSALIVPLIS
ncbi:MAG: DUF554 domain-containing protein [Erysipelotrichaceae bacterium]|nr:DUF554 domain-containing protein [Erysipelotrichaceae bacterium]